MKKRTRRADGTLRKRNESPRIVPCLSTEHRGHRKMRVAGRCDSRTLKRRAVDALALEGNSE